MDTIWRVMFLFEAARRLGISSDDPDLIKVARKICGKPPSPTVSVTSALNIVGEIVNQYTKEHP